jgi:ribosomal protein S18 acetylase RimI-like enzyme
MTCIRQAKKDDLASLVQIHTQAFRGFVLTTLGSKFLFQLYKGFLELPDGVLLVISASSTDVSEPLLDDRVLGFIAGTSKPDQFFALLRRKRWLRFAIAALPALIRHPGIIAERLVASLRYGGDSLPELPGYWLLSSLAVKPGTTGSGFGSDLVQKFCSVARNGAAAGVYLTTDAQDNDGVRAFYTRNGFTVCARMTRPNGRGMMVYVRKFSNDNAE